VLEVKPGSQWKTEDMKQEYKDLADRHGTPRAVLVDGASELRDGAKCLEERGNNTIVLRDFKPSPLKHRAANVLKSLFGKDKRFLEVGGQIGKTRSAIQQTELAHLTPPSPKQKARFMNLASTIRWMTMILWLLRNPDAKARAGISDERMQEKLGWVAEYEDDIPVWQECQTEILESAFGLYKQLERQHSKSGFTSLLACLPALLKPTTADGVREAFQRVSAKDVKTWVKKYFSSTVASRRNAAYAEHKKALKSATVLPVTT